MISACQPPILKCRTLAEAGESWLTRKVQEHKTPKTIECCRSYLKALLAFFGEMRLYEIDAGSLVAYQSTRCKAVGPSATNHEINALAQIMRLAACWGPIADSYKPLKEKAWQTLTAQEERFVFAEAANDAELELAHIVFTISRNAGVTATELRRTRLRDLDLDSHPPTLYVSRDTDEHTIPRLIPLDGVAQQAFRRAIERASKLGARYPEQFIFPFRRDPGHYDPSRPASKSWLRHQTKVLKHRTGISKLSPRIYRDQLCTEMLEQGIQPAVVEGLMGRVSEKMVAAHVHTQIRAKQEALAQLRGNMISFPGGR